MSEVPAQIHEHGFPFLFPEEQQRQKYQNTRHAISKPDCSASRSCAALYWSILRTGTPNVVNFAATSIAQPRLLKSRGSYQVFCCLFSASSLSAISFLTPRAPCTPTNSHTRACFRGCLSSLGMRLPDKRYGTPFLRIPTPAERAAAWTSVRWRPQ